MIQNLHWTSEISEAEPMGDDIRKLAKRFGLKMRSTEKMKDIINHITFFFEKKSLPQEYTSGYKEDFISGLLNKS